MQEHSLTAYPDGIAMRLKSFGLYASLASGVGKQGNKGTAFTFPLNQWRNNER